MAIPGIEQTQEVEQFTKPGTANVSPSDLAKLGPLMKHYAGKAHPFTVCKRDQMKHGLSEDHANRRCAVLKDLIRGTTKWRGNEALEPEEQELMQVAWKVAEHAQERLAELAEVLGPGLVAEFATATPVEEIWKPWRMIEREFDTAKRKKLAGQGKALPDGSYPIENAGDLSNALKAIGRAKDRGRVLAWIKKRAKALGLTKLLPDWAGGSASKAQAELIEQLVEDIGELSAAVEVWG